MYVIEVKRWIYTVLRAPSPGDAEDKDHGQVVFRTSNITTTRLA